MFLSQSGVLIHPYDWSGSFSKSRKKAVVVRTCLGSHIGTSSNKLAKAKYIPEDEEPYFTSIFFGGIALPYSPQIFKISTQIF